MVLHQISHVSQTDMYWNIRMGNTLLVALSCNEITPYFLSNWFTQSDFPFEWNRTADAFCCKGMDWACECGRMAEDLLRLNPGIWCRRFLAKSTVLNYSFKTHCKVHSAIGGSLFLFHEAKITTSAEAALVAWNKKKKQEAKHLKRTLTTFAKVILSQDSEIILIVKIQKNQPLS